MIRTHAARLLILLVLTIASAVLAAGPAGSPAAAGGAEDGERFTLADGGQFVFWELGPAQAGEVFQTVVIAWLFDATAVSWVSFIPALGTVNFALGNGAVL